MRGGMWGRGGGRGFWDGGTCSVRVVGVSGLGFLGGLGLGLLSTASLSSLSLSFSLARIPYPFDDGFYFPR